MEHSNPCKGIRKNPFIRKTPPSPMGTNLAFPIQSNIPVYHSTKPASVPIPESKNSPPFHDSRPPNHSYHPTHKRAATTTDISTQNVIERSSSHYSTMANLSKDIKFLRDCYEQAAIQNESLIHHISTKHRELDQLAHKYE